MNDAPQYAKLEPARHKMTEPTLQLRWLSVVGLGKTLQQCWAVKTYVGVTCESIEYDWRDVPTEN